MMCFLVTIKHLYLTVSMKIGRSCYCWLYWWYINCISRGKKYGDDTTRELQFSIWFCFSASESSNDSVQHFFTSKCVCKSDNSTLSINLYYTLQMHSPPCKFLFHLSNLLLSLCYTAAILQALLKHIHLLGIVATKALKI